MGRKHVLTGLKVAARHSGADKRIQSGIEREGQVVKLEHCDSGGKKVGLDPACFVSRRLGLSIRCHSSYLLRPLVAVWALPMARCEIADHRRPETHLRRSARGETRA